jgi:serine/threonine protein kinase
VLDALWGKKAQSTDAVVFDEKADIYSFGVILSELFTGQRPASLKGITSMRDFVQHMCRSDETPAALLLPQKMPSALYDIVSLCLDPKVCSKLVTRATPSHCLTLCCVVID